MWWKKITALLLFSAATSLAGTIHLKTRTIETTMEPSGLPAADEQHLPGGHPHQILEFAAPVTPELLAELAGRGIRVTSSLGAHTLMASVPDGSLLQGLDLHWTGQLHTADKLSAQLDREPGSPSGWVVEFHRDVLPAAALAIAKRSGLAVVHSPALLPNQLIVRGDRAALPGLARWDEVAYIFPASHQLVESRGVMPCAGALSTGGTTAQYVTQGTGWTLNSTNGLVLNYVFTTLTAKVPDAQVQSEIIRAMREWSKHANVQFVLGSDPAAPWTVAIEFGTAVNNDPTPFDAAGTILAHTYYPAPPNPEPIAGDLHFNPAENWHVGATTDIYTVALHELGHALGLGHTDDPNDVMYPYYRFGAGLDANDIAGVQSLYGVAGTPVATPPAATQAPLSLSISSPVTNARITAATASISGTLRNASSAAVVVWQSANGQSGQATGTSSWSINHVPLATGVNLITVTATDPGQAPVTRLLRLIHTGVVGAPPPTSTVPPSLVITSTTGATSLSMSGSASDPAGIAQITWQTNSGATGIALGTTSWTAAGIPLYPGDNVIIVRSYNTSGQMRWVSLDLQR